MTQFAGHKKGDRVRFEAMVRDSAYSHADLPTEYNGMMGTLTEDNDGWDGAVYVRWDIPEIRDYPSLPDRGYRAAMVKNLVVVERPQTFTAEEVKRAVALAVTVLTREAYVGNAAVLQAVLDGKFEIKEAI